MPWWGWLLVGIGVLIVGFIVFVVIFGRRMQRKQAEAEQQMELTKQTVSMLIIDKQKKKMKESGLPESILAQSPKYARNLKVPVVKAKVGTRVMTLLADQGVFEILPVKKTCTVTVAGLYIKEIKSVRGGSVPKLPEKKKGFMQKLREKAIAAQNKE
ncbi:MAG: hypothetical protein IKY02_03475 [Lachnospiraceae bacterium]|nr:hypothetical protein [Lachnospiraceae bacterium]MBR5739029.1 hypothetical protein [Lachnospiraceae bacterium]